MAKNKQNPLLAQYEALWERRYQARLHESLRLGEDALLIATDEVVGLTEKQAAELRRVYCDTLREIAKMVVEDSKDDPDTEWSRAKVDDRIRSIVGDSEFQPWDERHK